MMANKNSIKKKQDPVKSAKTAQSRRQLFLLAGAVAFITLFSFSPAMENNFINWDDNAYVFENMQLSKPIPEAISYFFEPHYFIGNYIPVTMIVYALEFHQVGLEPHFYHTVNVFIHLLNVLLVFWFIYLLSGKKPIVAAIVSLFFGIHPMHVESVAWIAELKDMLYSFFFLSGLIAYCKYTEENEDNVTPKPVLSFPILAFVFYILSVLSKPAAIVFPLVLVLLDFYNGCKFDKRMWIEKVPFFILSFIFGIVAVIAQQADRLIHDYYPFSQRFFFAAHSVLEYLVKLFLPVNLSIFYPYPQLVDGHLPHFFYLTPLIVAALFYGVYRTLKYTRLIAFGFLFFLVNLLLVLQLLSIGDAIMADRYTYIPYIGLLFIIAMGFDWLYNSAKEQLSRYKPVAIAAIIVLAISCSYLTHARCGVWENNDTIATDLLNKFPDDRLALNNKGFLLFTEGRYEESVPLFTKAIQLKPDYVMAYINLINSYVALKDIGDAVKTGDMALARIPQDYNVLNAKGYLFFIQNQNAEAVKYYNESIALKADNINGYLHLAECYYRLQDYNKAIETLDAALKYEPDNYLLLNNKGYILFVMGRYAEAVNCYKASLERKPDYATASVNLANCYKVMGAGK